MVRIFLRSFSLLAALAFFTFLLADWAPGDFLTQFEASSATSAEASEALRNRLALDQPLLSRFSFWLASWSRGECGVSLAYQTSVCGLLAPRLLTTLQLNFFATLLAWLSAAALAIPAASRPKGWVDLMLSGMASLLLGLPEILLALLAVWLLGFHSFLPYAVLALAALPTLALHLRASFTEALAHPAVRASQHYGIRGFALWWHYVLPLAAPPIIALAGLSFGGLLSGSLLVEAALGVPGMGSLVLEAVEARDTAVVAAGVGASGLLLMAANLLSRAAQESLRSRL